MTVALARPLLAAAVYGAAATATAAGLQVTPILVEIPRGESSAVLWLSNTGDAALRAQVRVFRWTQDDTGDQLEASTELVASPPMLEVAPGQRQLVRVIRPRGDGGPGETSFRLLVDELPPPVGSEQGVRFVLRYSVPVFTGGDGSGTPQLQWRVTGSPAALEVANTGPVRAQLSEVGLVGADGTRSVISAGLLGYVLPGSRMRWQLPPSVDAAGASALRARINGEPLEQAIPRAADR